MTQLSLETSNGLVRAEFSDVEEMCASVRTWDLDFKPLQRVPSSGRVGSIIQRRVGPLEFGYARCGVSLEQHGAPPSGLITFVVLEALVHRHWWEGHDMDADTVMVSLTGSEFCSYSGPTFETHTVSVSEDTVEQICERFQITPPGTRVRPVVFRPSLDLLDRVRRGFRKVRDEGSVDAFWQANVAFEELVVEWIQGSVGTGRESLRAKRARDRAVRRCLEHMRHAPWHTLSPGKLCEIANLSERSLQLAFRERFGLTPAAFLKARRLSMVRQQLLRSHSEQVSIGEAAATQGFTHVGQFAADYRRAFGETPSETLARFRAGYPSRSPR
jgi:AraC-like DNA-binding protein